MRAYKVPCILGSQLSHMESCINAELVAENIYIKEQLHFYHVYGAYLKQCSTKRHPVKARKDLTNAEKSKTKALFLSAIRFEKWFNNTYRYLPEFTNYHGWIENKDEKIPSHTIRQGFKKAQRAFYLHKHNPKHFQMPRIKSYRFGHHTSFFDQGIKVKRGAIKVTKFDWIPLKRYGRVPLTVNKSNNKAHIFKYQQLKWSPEYHIVKAIFSILGRQAFVSVVTNEPLPNYKLPSAELHGHIGADMNLGHESVTFNNATGQINYYPNICKTTAYQRDLHYQRKYQKEMRRRPANKSKIIGQRQHQADLIISTSKNKYLNSKVKWLFKKYRFNVNDSASKGYAIAKIRYENKCRKTAGLQHGHLKAIAYKLIQQHPKSITIEHLGIKDMMQNHKLARSIQQASWYYFFNWLKWLCRKYGIELRRVSRTYPSTKVCCFCYKRNHKQFTGTLKDLGVRTLHCPSCGWVIDRDLNAAVNLANAKKYTVLTNTMSF